MMCPLQFAVPFRTGGGILLMALLICGSLTPLQAQDYQAPKIISEGEVVTTQGWLWGFFGGGGEHSAPLFERERPMPRERPATPDGSTVCVRLCDGFFWPVSQSTASTNVSHAAKQCEQACPGRSRLFIRNLGTEPSDMVDLQGRPYSKLENAFRHQREYVSDCTCRGHPWDEESLARHRAYAEAAQGKAGAKHAIRAPEQTNHPKRKDRPQ
jgi:hypothetical protein